MDCRIYPNILPFEPNQQAINEDTHILDTSLVEEHPSFIFNSDAWKTQAYLTQLETNTLSLVDTSSIHDTGYGGSTETSPDTRLPSTGIFQVTYPQETIAEPNNTAQTPKRTRATRKVLAEQEPTLPPRKFYRRRNAASKDMKDLNDDDDDENRQRFLLRNREAATKCREKKKAWVSDLQEQAHQLQLEKQALTMQATILKSELLRLKYQCLEHTNCDCVSIRTYLKDVVMLYSSLENATLYCKLEDETC